MTKKSNKKKLLLTIFIAVVAGVILLPFSSYVISYQAKERSILAYDDATEFSQHYGFLQDHSSIGIIYYPGGLVSPQAYASFAQKLSERSSYSVFVTYPWFNLAISQIQLADSVREQHPTIQTWIIGGHSLGGTAAAFYAIDHLDQIQGLFLLASYTTQQADFSSSNLPIISIGGTNDQVLNQLTYDENRQYLSSNVSEVMIEGGNHGQFGDYGPQRGDGVATIESTVQETMIIEALTNWFQGSIFE